MSNSRRLDKCDDYNDDSSDDNDGGSDDNKGDDNISL